MGKKKVLPRERKKGAHSPRKKTAWRGGGNLIHPQIKKPLPRLPGKRKVEAKRRSTIVQRARREEGPGPV